MTTTSTHDTRAVARYSLAQAIIKADNRNEIMVAFAELGCEYEAMVSLRKEVGDHDSALRWNRVLEEISTIVMCAAINIEEAGA